MKRRLLHIYHDSWVRRPLSLSFYCAVPVFAVTVWKWTSFPPQIPLFYSLPQGQEQLASPYHLFILPLIMSLMMCGTAIVAYTTHEKNPFISRMLSVSCVIASMMMTIAWMHSMARAL